MAKEAKGKAEQKKYIAEYAFNEFKKKGIKAVKTDDLATGLGVSKRTIYELFEDKESLLVEGLKLSHEQSRIMFEEAFTQEGTFFDAFLKWLKESNRQIQEINRNFLIDLGHYQKVTDFLAQQEQHHHQESKIFMEKGIKEGVFRNDIDYDILINMQDVLKKQLIHLSLVNESNFGKYFKSVHLVILRGICTDKGLEILNKYKF